MVIKFRSTQDLLFTGERLISENMNGHEDIQMKIRQWLKQVIFSLKIHLFLKTLCFSLFTNPSAQAGWDKVNF